MMRCVAGTTGTLAPHFSAARGVRSLVPSAGRAASMQLQAPVALRSRHFSALPASLQKLVPKHDSHKVDNEDLLAPSDTFMARHIGPSEAEIQEMLAVVGSKDLKSFVESVVPSHIRRTTPIELDESSGSETAVLATLQKMHDANRAVKNFMGMGYHGCVVPGVIQRNVLENPAWYTAYTPYQAEISQGRLEALLNYQTVVTELTGMELSNASLLDESSAAAEAMTMVARSTPSKKDMFFISDQVHPQTIAVVEARAEWMDIKIVVGDWKSFDFSKENLSGALVQYPDTSGSFEDYSTVSKTLKANKGMLVVATDPLALCVAKPPADFGADICVGTLQRFGVPMCFGGPAAGFLASSKSQIRRMPGRIIGVSKDAAGEDALRMTLQTREQHIRLERATSNICTAQALLANMSSFYAVYHGPSGLVRIAGRVHALTNVLNTGAAELGLQVVNGKSFFDTITIDVSPSSSEAVAAHLLQRGISVRRAGPETVSIALDETHGLEDVENVLVALATATSDVHKSDELARTSVKAMLARITPTQTGDLVCPEFQRSTEFMKQKVFTTIQTETEMLRYMYRLQLKDLSLCTSMITLGSCTMKLNSTASMVPVTWPNFANVHPFAPAEITKGYRQMLHELERLLCSITAFDACSLQPASGASGEYTGLLAIRQYHRSIGESQRDVCVIPRSAHGTNPASAAMAGMKIKWIDDSKGMNLEQLEALIKEHEHDLSCLMITYPSTHGIFEQNIDTICDLVHKYGGNVYMDGANMNAQVGLTAPGVIGADVCHLNLHKTFSIPHGGGGPGLGPICVRKHLAPFLPNHPVVSLGAQPRGRPVQGAPWGQAGIAMIPWMYIKMLGQEGLERSTTMAILNANYMMVRLAEHYPLKATGANDRCSHEFILDVSQIKATTDISEEDIAKRLQDYGFHAPTMSWPVHNSLMIEPTESEPKPELDRFVDALISIRAEIKQIEDGVYDHHDNPLKMAPHTQKAVCATEWTHPYSREVAAFPAPWTHSRGKFWPTTARVNNVHGDKVLVCTLSE